MPFEYSRDDLFPFFQCWREPIEALTQGMRNMLKTRELRGADLLRAARLIHAIEGLPLRPDVELIQASLAHEEGRERSWLSVTLSRDSFELSRGGTTQDTPFTESEYKDVLYAEVGVGTNRSKDDPIAVMIEIEDWVAEWNEWACDTSYSFTIYDEEVSTVNVDAAWELLDHGA